MIQAIVKDIGGTIEAQFLDGAPTSCTVTLYTSEGAKRIDGEAATVDPVSTTLASSASIGARATYTVELTSTAGIVGGRRYLLGTVGSTEPYEHVSVKSITGSTVSLWAPLLYSHAAGAAFRGTRVSYDVASTAATATWTGGHAVFAPDSGDPVTETVHCVRSKIPTRLIDLNDVRSVYARIDKLVSGALDVPQALLDARDAVLLDLAPTLDNPHTVLASGALRRLAALKFVEQRGPELGEGAQVILEAVRAEYKGLLESLQSNLPVDGDQDGATTGVNDKEAGGFGGSVRIYRCG